jgi:4-amino-4-deoxy-L-arabinose transferase-like glycosyltransferase
MVNWIKNLSNKKVSAIVTLVAGAIFFSRLYEPSLSGDAAKYALIAKTMVQTGDFLIPRLGEELYLKKPPFFFWLMGGSFKLFGFNEFAARLPTATFAVISALLLYTLTLKATKNKTLSLLSSLIFCLNFEVIRISTVVRFESFILAVNLATVLLLLNPSRVRSTLAVLILSAGILTKGPFALVGALAVIIYGIIRKERKVIIHSLLVTLGGALLSSLYFLYLFTKEPQFFKEFFGNQIVGRITGSLKEGTPRAFYFYERLILKHFWPWNIFLIYAIYSLAREKELVPKEVKERRFYEAMLVLFLLFFIPLHFISLKFTRYSYYLYPFLSFLTAVAIGRLKLNEKALKLSAVLAGAYLLVAATCPCHFHKDKIKKARALVKVALENYTPLGLSESVPKLERYALYFYFDRLSRKPKFLISKGRCESSLLKLGNYCVVKVKSEVPSGYNGKRLERRH